MAIKNDIIIYEGEFIKEIIFVKNGLIELNISIDLNNPELSNKKFYGKKMILGSLINLIYNYLK